MRNHFNISYVSEIFKFYNEIRKKTVIFKLAAGLRCIPGCGSCCENPEVEAAVVEMYPAAVEIYRKNQEDMIFEAIENKIRNGDFSCVFYQPDPDIPGNGKCTQYRYRAVVCRLFGFAARRNKFGQLEFCPCRLLKEKNPDMIKNAALAVSNGIDIPVYQDSFMHMASIHPDSGFHTMPINLAIKQALEYIYWKKPLNFRQAKAS